MKRHHLKNGSFRNNAKISETHRSLVSILKWKLNSPRVKRIKFPVVESTPDDLYRVNSQAVTWIGHATFLIQYAGINILTDPHFSKRASPSQRVGPARTTKPALKIQQLPHIDVVVISHDHYDHLDENSVLELCSSQPENPPLFLVPLKLGRWLSKRGITSWLELDWWESVGHDDWSFHAVPTQHFSGRGLKPNNTLWAGWVLEYKGKDQKPFKLFFAGDTGYSNDFKQIGKKFGPIDLSLIPIGAYAPRWFMKDVHVNPEEAVKIHLDTKSKRSIAMHWGSFVLTDECMDQPPKNLEIEKTKRGLQDDDFIAVDHGQTISLTD